MDIGRPGTILRHLHDLLDSATAQGLSDAQLLGRYAEHRDETAFATLVARHARLVWGVCRHRLHCDQDAEDAFQATFFILARRAGSIRKAEAVASWLHGVAYRVAMKAKKSARKRQIREQQAVRTAPSPPPSDLSWRELQAALDEEVQRLPERYRAPFVLCCLEGRSREEAADEIGCALGTVSSRIARARRLLQGRLAQRGMTLSAALCASELWGETIAAALPDGLMRSAVQAGATTANSIPASATALAEGVLRTMRWMKWKVGSVLMLSVGVLAAAAAVGGDPPATPSDVPKGKAAVDAAPTKKDLYGDPLPDGAVMRLGTVGFRVPDVAGVGFRPTGELVAFTEDLSLYVWPPDGTPKPRVTPVAGTKEYGWRRALSADSRFAAAFLNSTRKLVVWDVSGEKPLEYLSRDAGDVYKVAFSPNGAWLAVNALIPRGEGTLLLCHLPTKKWDPLPFPGRYAESLSFTPDGKGLAVTAQGNMAPNGIVTVIDTAARQERLRAEFPKDIRPKFAALSPDGKTLAVQPAAWIEPVQFLSVESGAKVTSLKGWSGTARWVARWAAFSPDGKTILLDGPRGVREWDPAGGKFVGEFPGPAKHPVVYAVDRRRLASHDGGAVLCWDVANYRHIRPDLAEAGHTDAVRGITVSPDGGLIATDSFDGDIRVWDAGTGRPVCCVRAPSLGNGRRVVFLPDSKSFIAVAEDCVTPVVRDAATGREFRRFAIPPDVAKAGAIHDLRLSADGKTLTTTGEVYTFHWEVATGRVVDRAKLPEDLREWGRDSATYSPDGRWVVKTGPPGPVGWQGGTVARVGAKEAVALVPPAESVMMAKFSDDSRLVAVPRTPAAAMAADPERGSLMVFDLAAKARIAELPTGQARRLAFSPDARQLAVVGPKEVALWDLLSGKAVRRYPSAHGFVLLPEAIAFAPDGRRLVTGHGDCTALVWELTGTGRAAGEVAPPLSADAVGRIWGGLAGDDAAQAYTAGWELRDRPKQAIATLRERLKPVRKAEEAIVRALVAKLDGPVFADREAADRELRRLGDSAAPALRAALKVGLSAEQAVRVERVLAALEQTSSPSGQALRELRAVQVLERIGSPEAKALLKELAGGVEGARLTVAAKEALGRLRDE
jgi:RNA polymerase sigma factor (sigma-70 family)